jgi:hypothetical protein
MFRFTIRDVLWLTVVVAFAVLRQMEILQRNIENPPDLRSDNTHLRKEPVRAQWTVKANRAYIKKLQDRLDRKEQP